MKKISRYICFSMLMLLLLNGCGFNNGGNNSSSQDIFQHKGSVIGDNSAVINIIGQLQRNQEFEELSLETKEKPYGMSLTYGNIDSNITEKEYKEMAIYNATFLFALIDNAEWITFNFDDKYKIDRSQLQDWYDEDLNKFTNEEELETFVQKTIDENKINQLFTKS
ncbi:DUF4825 domain-containing protein [Salibacterium halotolerans]|uniref:DUF4825 domain-containing protein n=1 Tax=Salibacterium halotolerans TaxID=1884432 RepID=A0A1I5NE35_9BACI|nr:DUF4825 domain-containing protein [Salibacterium halotolerans]SFP19491.1 protein of unknown function [Salibacterium halotolerans]